MHSALFAFVLIGYNNRIGDVNLIDDFERVEIDICAVSVGRRLNDIKTEKMC